MEIIPLDFETYYDKDYSLSKMTTEEYINDKRFEVIMVGVRWPGGNKEIITGDHKDIQAWFDGIDWSQRAILAHNTLFDGAIASWKFGVRPKLWLDTLSMARAMFGVKGNSLEALAKKYNLEDKKTFILNAMGKRRQDFTMDEFEQYSDYCLHDVELCWDIFSFMRAGWYNFTDMDMRGLYPNEELKLIDVILRMFTEPALVLNRGKLEKHLQETTNLKEKLMRAANIDREVLLSNNKFAERLKELGVEPPTKISPTTKKVTWAFSKTDKGLQNLLEHEDFEIQSLVTARLGVKSTLEETRTQRFIGISGRTDLFPVPLRYAAARTHRLGGCLVASSVVSVYDPKRDQALQKKIIEVMPDDLVWDGEEFVEHMGVSFNGYAEVIEYDGICGTADHRVFCTDETPQSEGLWERTLGEAKSTGSRIAPARDFTEYDVDLARQRYNRDRA